ncbi:MAG: hypothetical protein ACLFRU_08890 [Paracoccaceae bacterium]
MFLELIATFVAGLAGAGLAMLVRRISGGRLPRWITPVAAGAAMLGVTISSEYGWYERTRAALPDGFTVARTVEERAWWRPWTLAAPYVERFVVVDRGSIRENSAYPDERLADLYFFGRWSPVRQVELRVDCATGRRALPGDGAGDTVHWQEVGTGDPLVVAVCAGTA